jgi:hypothetical protein
MEYLLAAPGARFACDGPSRWNHEQSILLLRYLGSSTVGEDFEAKRKRWHTAFQKIQDELWIDPPYPTHLYHYSNLAGIRGILTSRTIWLSDILTMKDKYDGTYWLKVFNPVLSRKSVPAWLKDFFQRGEIGLGTDWYTYVACFSPESELEYQWEHYADDGKGCALELSFEALRENSDNGRELAWTPMLYDASEQIVKATQTIDAAISMYRNESMKAREQKHYWTAAGFSFLLCGPRFKHPRFHREQEWRIFRSRPNREGAEYRPADSNQQIPYWSLGLKPEMVTGLIKGAACTCPDADLIALLSAGGYGTNIRSVR